MKVKLTATVVDGKTTLTEADERDAAALKRLASSDYGPMPIAQIIDMPGAGAREYEQASRDPSRRDVAEGQLDHIAGPTPDGFRVIDVWESEEAFARFEREVLEPLGFAGAPRIEFPVHTRFARAA